MVNNHDSKKYICKVDVLYTELVLSFESYYQLRIPGKPFENNFYITYKPFENKFSIQLGQYSSH